MIFDADYYGTLFNRKITSEDVGEEKEFFPIKWACKPKFLNCLKKDAYINKKPNKSQQLECKFIPYEVNS